MLPRQLQILQQRVEKAQLPLMHLDHRLSSLPRKIQHRRNKKQKRPTASRRKRQRRTQKQRHSPLQSRQRQVRWSLRVLQQQPQRQKKHREKQ